MDGRDCLFKRDHHIRIATILQSLDAAVLNQYNCFFGGGTAIVLAREEYRESTDIDFLVSDKIGYQKIRQLLTGEGIKAITRPGGSIETARDILADQYGIRTMLRVGDVEIKFEIVFEAHVQLEVPPEESKICGISTLTPLDMATTKLLANSDRWSDDAVNSRDLIDLAMVELPKSELIRAIEKSSEAYGESITRDLLKAIDALKQRRGRLEICMEALKMNKLPRAVLWSKIRQLYLSLSDSAFL